jgi:hypothetical protein
MRSILSLVALSFILPACGEPQSASQGSGGQSNAAGVAGRVTTSSGGTLADAGSTSGGTSSRNTGGGSGSFNQGGSTASGGSGAAGGIASSCVCPPSAPVASGLCDSGCDGQVCVYEDCAGRGFLQSACASGTWFEVQQICGDTQCGPPNMPSEMNCAPGYVCVYVASAPSSVQCRPHHCGTGPITCDCLGSSCTGTCSSYGPKWFTCGGTG